jgi:hypothetical protein
VLAPASRRSGAEERLYLHSHRVVTQSERVWIVREADTSLSPNAPRTKCLLCESALTVRRAWDYPREWARLSDSELLKLFS